MTTKSKQESLQNGPEVLCPYHHRSLLLCNCRVSRGRRGAVRVTRAEAESEKRRKR